MSSTVVCEHYCAGQVIGDGPQATCMCGALRWTPHELAGQATDGNRPRGDDLIRVHMQRLAREIASQRSKV